MTDFENQKTALYPMTYRNLKRISTLTKEPIIKTNFQQLFTLNINDIKYLNPNCKKLDIQFTLKPKNLHSEYENFKACRQYITNLSRGYNKTSL